MTNFLPGSKKSANRSSMRITFKFIVRIYFFQEDIYIRFLFNSAKIGEKILNPYKKRKSV